VDALVNAVQEWSGRRSAQTTSDPAGAAGRAELGAVPRSVPCHGLRYHGRGPWTFRDYPTRGPTLIFAGLGLAAYALLDGVEAIGLWFARRCAEYLTSVVTAVLLEAEMFDLTRSVSVLKILALIINSALVIYLDVRQTVVRAARRWRPALIKSTPAQPGDHPAFKTEWLMTIRLNVISHVPELR
jgi:hypothetical protein